MAAQYYDSLSHTGKRGPPGGFAVNSLPAPTERGSSSHSHRSFFDFDPVDFLTCGFARKANASHSSKPLINDCNPAQLAAVDVIFSDMDGTWLDRNHLPSSGGLAAIQEAEAAGLTFCFATGRCPASAAGRTGDTVADIMTRPGVYANGSMVVGPGGDLLYTADISADAVAKVVAIAAEEGITCQLCDRNTFYLVDGGTPMASHLQDVYHDPKTIPCPNSPTLPIAQLVHLVAQPATLDALHARVSAAVGLHASVSRNLPTDIVVTSKEAHKATGCAKLAAALGKSTTLCIGDSGNDVTMLRAASIGVAMANARAETMAAARFVTFCTNHSEDDGVAVGVLEAVRAVVAAKKAKGT
mmetsp:Transcript_27397/g.69709  ORF Transcript_27397/g.69709 Transcript_27397/m.69709 type:complete len:356 (+) Transcript_27397:29-1096(+)